jgi:hypothetical protein
LRIYLRVEEADVTSPGWRQEGTDDFGISPFWRRLERNALMYIGIGTIVLIVIIVLVVLMLRRR